jgi:hypothetical protein
MTYHTRNHLGMISSEKRGLVYRFPPLGECRQRFTTLLNEKMTWEVRGDWS